MSLGFEWKIFFNTPKLEGEATRFLGFVFSVIFYFVPWDGKSPSKPTIWENILLLFFNHLKQILDFFPQQNVTKQMEREGIWRGLDMKVQDSSSCKLVFLTMECQQSLLVSLVGGCPILRILAPDNSKLAIFEDPKTSLLYMFIHPLDGPMNLRALSI